MYHFCLSQHYEVVYLHTLGEVDSFNTQFGTQCSSYMCQIFEVIAKKNFGYFLWIQCILIILAFRRLNGFAIEQQQNCPSTL